MICGKKFHGSIWYFLTKPTSKKSTFIITFFRSYTTLIFLNKNIPIYFWIHDTFWIHDYEREMFTH